MKGAVEHLKVSFHHNDESEFDHRNNTGRFDRFTILTTGGAGGDPPHQQYRQRQSNLHRRVNRFRSAGSCGCFPRHQRRESCQDLPSSPIFFFFVPIYFNPLLSYLKSGNVITSNFELIEARGGENEPLENHQFNQTQKRLANIELTAIVERCRRLRRRFDSRPPVGAPPDGRIPVHFSMDRLFNSEGIYLHLEWFQCFNVFVVPPQIQFSLKIGFIGN